MFTLSSKIVGTTDEDFVDQNQVDSTEDLELHRKGHRPETASNPDSDFSRTLDCPLHCSTHCSSSATSSPPHIINVVGVVSKVEPCCKQTFMRLSQIITLLAGSFWIKIHVYIELSIISNASDLSKYWLPIIEG